MTLVNLAFADGVAVDYVLLNIAGNESYLYTSAQSLTSATRELFFISTDGTTTSLGVGVYEKLCAVPFDNQNFRIFWNESSSIVYRDFNFINLTLSSPTTISIVGQDVFVRRFNNTYLMTYILSQNLNLARRDDGSVWEFDRVLSSRAILGVRRAEFNLQRLTNGFNLQLAEVKSPRSSIYFGDADSESTLSSEVNDLLVNVV